MNNTIKLLKDALIEKKRAQLSIDYCSKEISDECEKILKEMYLSKYMNLRSDDGTQVNEFFVFDISVYLPSYMKSVEIPKLKVRITMLISDKENLTKYQKSRVEIFKQMHSLNRSFYYKGKKELWKKYDYEIDIEKVLKKSINLCINKKSILEYSSDFSFVCG